MITEYPKISIVIPSLNQGKYIEATIRSVLLQEYPSLELLVFDGGSEDETITVLKKYGDRLHWISQKDNGQTDAINQGLRKASGEIVSYLNADDLLLPGSLMRVAQEFIMRHDTLWLTGRCRIIDQKDREIRRLITLYKNFLLLTNSRYALMVTNYISQPATFWRRSAMEQAGWLDENLQFVMDYDYWFRLWMLAPPQIVPCELAAFRVHAQSKTTSAGHMEKYVGEEAKVLARNTNSYFWRGLHNLHRRLMTILYTCING